MSIQHDGIWSDAQINGGQPLIQGDRIAVAQVLRMVATYLDEHVYHDLSEAYHLSEEQIQNALEFAATSIEQSDWSEELHATRASITG